MWYVYYVNDINDRSDKMNKFGKCVNIVKRYVIKNDKGEWLIDKDKDSLVDLFMEEVKLDSKKRGRYYFGIIERYYECENEYNKNKKIKKN